MTLKELKIGKTAVIQAVGGEGALRQHFLDMGLIPGVEVTLVKYAPMGDPMELRVHGYELTLRLDDASKIEVNENKIDEYHANSKIALEENSGKSKKKKEIPHPGLGEGGKYHPKGSGNPLPDGEVLTKEQFI